MNKPAPKEPSMDEILSSIAVYIAYEQISCAIDDWVFRPYECDRQANWSRAHGKRSRMSDYGASAVISGHNNLMDTGWRGIYNPHYSSCWIHQHLSPK